MDIHRVKKLLVYPLKSAKPIELTHTKVEFNGFQNDRNYAIIDQNNKVLTAREYSKFLHLIIKVNQQMLHITLDNAEITINVDQFDKMLTEVHLFDDIVKVQLLKNTKINKLLSEYLNISCRLIKLDSSDTITSKKAFNDIAPIHLISEASLNDLNNRIGTHLTAESFRPNLIVTGGQAYEEELWKTLKIGNIIFNVVSKTNRCSLSTIDPITLKQRDNQEPLRTLATFKKEGKSVCFGIYLVPTNKGEIFMDAPIEIID
ncbi:MOSC domain-containing protein [Aquimarina agarivorans]|uniref:MOSC domain-containing protein n=1 Tax=Aquimarina agarivorans TaxID=980584 RepID=UPI000248EDA4|nr:MOSC domain-containing protein [Aquimarina agarivorans]